MRKTKSTYRLPSNNLKSQSMANFRRVAVLLFCPLLLLIGLAFSVRWARGDVDDLSLPVDFTVNTIATGLRRPVDMVFLPNGDILVAEKGAGQAEKGWSSVKLVRNGVVQAEPVLTLSTNTFWDSGLMAIVLDPNFSQNHRFYVWYATGENSLGWTGESALRLSRFKYDPSTGQADLAGETIILEDKPWSNYHQGNILFFNQDGNLFIGMGNRGELPSSQDMSVLYGKIIRIRPNESGYDIPPDNPYLGDPDARPEIYAIGIRNVYRMAGRDEDGTLVFGDVGENTWEEINLLYPASNYGYPEREGPCPIHQKEPCEPAPDYYRDPIISYLHDESLGVGTSGAITGLTFYEGEGFPEIYRNKLFFTDFNQRFIAYADPPSGNYDIFSENTGNLVDLEYYREGLYMLEVFTGRIKLVTYDGQDNQAPRAVISASPLTGSAPLEVAFSAAGSEDPDDIVVHYHWDFGDNSPPLVTNEEEISHIYQQDGTYEATLQVVDVRGAKSDVVRERITVYSGELPVLELQNLTEPGRELYHGGDNWRYEAVRSNLDGLDPDKPFSWQIAFHHNQQIEVIVSDSAVISDVLSISTENLGGDWYKWYEFELTMFTDSGQQIKLGQKLVPAATDLRIETRPRSIEVLVNQEKEVAPHSYQAIVGIEQELIAAPHMIFNDDIWVFNRWVGQGSIISMEAQLTFLAPEQDETYTAAYIYDRPAEKAWLPLLRN